MVRSNSTPRRRITVVLGTVAVMSVLAVAVIAPPMAVGQATRTWVSGVGDDANPCSRTAPCKTFAGAISKTATSGEINCMDPGGFGGVTITKSLIIDCTGTLGGVLTAGAGVNGIVINLPSVTDHVLLRGLDMNGAGSAQNGIRIVSGGQVDIDEVFIRGYRAANGLGISVAPAGALELNIRNSVIAANGTGATGGGILVQPTGAGGTAKVTLDNVALSNNVFGLRVTTTGNTGPASSVTVVDSSVTANTQNGVAAVSGNSAESDISILMDRSVSSYNGQSGVVASGVGTLIRVANSTVTGNSTGTNPLGGGVVESYGNNQIRGNVNDGARTVITPE